MCESSYEMGSCIPLENLVYPVAGFSASESRIIHFFCSTVESTFVLDPSIASSNL